MAVGDPHSPQTVHNLYCDFMGRRSALVKALTTDVETLFARCHPERENLCLYGYPDGKWEVKLPSEVPSEVPEPTVGINFARDGMPEAQWLYLVAVHSDSWLLATTFHNAAKYGCDKDDRERLFTMINDLPTISEVLTEEAAKKQPKENSESSDSSNNSKSGSIGGGSQSGNYSECSQLKDKDKSDEEDHDEEDHDEDEKTLCGMCGQSETSETFWLCCDTCDEWFHGKCVRLSPAMVARMQKYECLLCLYNKARP